MVNYKLKKNWSMYKNIFLIIKIVQKVFNYINYINITAASGLRPNILKIKHTYTYNGLMNNHAIAYK